MGQTVDQWIKGYRDAWERRDPVAASELFSPSSTYRSNIFEESHQGREGVEDYWKSVTASQSDIRVRMGRPFVDGRRLAVEFWTTMRIDGDEVTLAGCLLVDFDDNGLCDHLREYWHFQPGLAEPPAGWGT